MAEQLANSAASTLSAAITSTSATTCTVANGTVFPATGDFRIIIDSELIIVGARSGNTLSSMTRGAESTTAATHLNGAAVTHVLTKGGLDAYVPSLVFSTTAAVAPSARVYHNANQSIANATTTSLAFNSERFDTDTIHDTVTNNSRLTCKTAGKYLITAHVRWAASSAGTYRTAGITLNGTTDIGYVGMAPGSAIQQEQNIVTIYDLAVNDYIQVLVAQDSGGALNAEALANRAPEFMMCRVA